MARHARDGNRIQTRTLAALSALLVALPPGVTAWAQSEDQTQAFSSEELEQLTAPIALYPDSLLAQVLMASTYPLEVVEAQRFAKANASLAGEALDKALQDKSWDDSVKSLVAFPQVLDMMSDQLDWTQKLGDAFLAQQSDVMDSIQRLRQKAHAQGSLESTKEQNVIVEQAPATTTVVQAAPPTVIRIEPTNPQVVYVPTYNPTIVYGAWPYPAYPPYAYYPPGYVAGVGLLSFGMGMAVGAALWGNCNWGWGHGDIKINYNNYNTFNRNVNRNWNQTDIQNKFQNGRWQHDTSHRRGVGYRDPATQQRFGKQSRTDAASREAFRGRAEQGRQQLARDNGAAARRDLGKAGPVQNSGQRASARANRPSGGSSGPSAPNRGGVGSREAGPRAGGAVGANRAASAGKAKAPAAFDRSSGGQQVRRDASRGEASRQSAVQRRGEAGGGARKGGGGGRGGR